MFLARDKNGRLVNALEDELVKQDYYCPACGTSVRMRKGKNVIFSMKMKDQSIWKTRNVYFIGLRIMMRLRWNISYLN